jgi:hypothetical protein
MVSRLQRLHARCAPLLALGMALATCAALDALALHADALGAALHLLTSTTP